ncbi:restriction endonuclease subunit S [Enterococcus lactis]|uniref:restriction endonuclease subunit S n=1 Tax=Enterococcus TaxID=1350 RepID=UPI0001CEAE09|nr:MULTISPECIES: restriction endonuclease subunit S [Enterococcus]EFF38418.1 type I restriction-modification system, S subunit, putative [Enterococcus faecium E980]EGP4829349.1 restriction endonuclease [Enterococcus faecium]EGP4976086.1 restriction endonuclease [Enterococcus faecium]EGP5430307.1 restriction endonuclease [Enterococcus faecium]EME7200150.1 restriction endonuclease subunit S [Enterococcus faecium]
MNAQDLKNSILQLAIQGKLVEQREEEGTAKELLEKIEVEKKRLIKEGKIKKEKKQLKISEDEVLFDIPESWEWTRMSNIADMYTGNSIPKTIKENKYSKVGNGYDYIGTKDVGFDYTINYDNGIKIPFEEDKFRNSFKDSILMCIEGGSAGRKIGILDKTVCFGNKLCSFNLIYGEPRFLYYYLQSPLFFQAFRDEMTGIIGGVSITKLKGIIVPLPPLEEQKRIVAKIEELMPYVDKYDVAYSEVEELNKKFPEDIQKSILQYAIQGKLVEQREEDGTAEDLYKQIQEEKKKLIKEGKIKKTKALPEITEDEIPFDIPENWKWVRLGDLLYKLTDGTHSTPKYTATGVPFISVKDISSGEIDFSNTKFISREEHEALYKRCDPERDDILLTKVGTTGIPVIVDTDKEFSLFVSVALLKFNTDLIFNKYFMYVIKAPVVQIQARENTRGVGNKNWVMRDIANTVLPLSPLAEQNRIVEKIEELLPYTNQLIKKVD